MDLDDKAWEAAKEAYDACFPDAVGVTFDGLRKGIEAYLSSHSSGGVPEGWAVVPREPTREMIVAAYNRDRDGTTTLYNKIWKAMLSASPPAPQAMMEGGWRLIETAPKDEHVLLATTGNWVGEAILQLCGEDDWQWLWVRSQPVHPNLKPLAWMPLPAAPRPDTPAGKNEKEPG